MSDSPSAEQVARANQEKINALINKCIVDTGQRQMLQMIAKSVWIMAFEAGMAKGIESIDPHGETASPDAVLGKLSERAELARDGALMREAVRVMNEMVKVLTPAQVATLGLSLHEQPPEIARPLRPLLRVVASNGSLTLESNGRN